MVQWSRLTCSCWWSRLLGDISSLHLALCKLTHTCRPSCVFTRHYKRWSDPPAHTFHSYANTCEHTQFFRGWDMYTDSMNPFHTSCALSRRPPLCLVTISFSTPPTPVTGGIKRLKRTSPQVHSHVIMQLADFFTNKVIFNKLRNECRNRELRQENRPFHSQFVPLSMCFDMWNCVTHVWLE